jgi:hypothetical protein
MQSAVAGNRTSPVSNRSKPSRISGSRYGAAGVWPTWLTATIETSSWRPASRYSR